MISFKIIVLNEQPNSFEIQLIDNNKLKIKYDF